MFSFMNLFKNKKELSYQCPHCLEEHSKCLEKDFNECNDEYCPFQEKSSLPIFSKSLDAEELLDSIQVKSTMLSEEDKLIPDIDLSAISWKKPVILIMDDEELVNFFLKQDLIYFQTIAEKNKTNISFNPLEKELIYNAKINNLDNLLFDFRVDTYDIISVSSEYAAFAIHRRIKDIKRVDFSLLDISLGGSLTSEDGMIRENLNGIDIAYDISKLHCDTSYMMYTGNSLGKYSPETLQFDRLLPHKGGLFEHLVNKDTPLMLRRLKLLSFLSGNSFNDVRF